MVRRRVGGLHKGSERGVVRMGVRGSEEVKDRGFRKGSKKTSEVSKKGVVGAGV